MLSDVLFDAAHAIRRYQEDYPDIYGGDIMPHIQYVLASMEMLRIYFDMVPSHRYGHVRLAPPDEFFAPARQPGAVSAVKGWQDVAALFDWGGTAKRSVT